MDIGEFEMIAGADMDSVDDEVTRSISVYGQVELSDVASAANNPDAIYTTQVPQTFCKLCHNGLTNFLHCSSVGSRIARFWGLISLTSVPVNLVQPSPKSKSSLRSGCRDKSDLFYSIIIFFL